MKAFSLTQSPLDDVRYPPGTELAEDIVGVSKLHIGYRRRLVGGMFEPHVGAALSFSGIPNRVEQAYGRERGFGVSVFLSLRPVRCEDFAACAGRRRRPRPRSQDRLRRKRPPPDRPKRRQQGLLNHTPAMPPGRRRRPHDQDQLRRTRRPPNRPKAGTTGTAEPHAGHAGPATARTPRATAGRAPASAAAVRPSTQAANFAVDPIDGLRVDPSTASRADFLGRTYYFCSGQHRDLFVTSPAKFLPRSWNRGNNRAVEDASPCLRVQKFTRVAMPNVRGGFVK